MDKVHEDKLAARVSAMDRRLEYEAVSVPDAVRPAMQSIVIAGRGENGQTVCKLEAVRFAEACFRPDEADNLVAAFDEHTAFAYGLAVAVKRCRSAMSKRYDDAIPFASGFIGILSIETIEGAAGQRLGLELIRYLKQLHAGMSWYVGLQAAPQDLKPGTAQYRQMRARLISYYASDRSLGFLEDSPKQSPGLMTACWSGE